MTDGKWTGQPFDTALDRQIREAQERGAFDDLAGAGKPIPDLDAPHDEMWWVKQLMRREKVSVLPPSLVLRKEVDDVAQTVSTLRTESAVRALVAELNARIAAATRTPPPGPPLNLRPLDVAQVVQDWRDQRAAQEQ